MPIERNSGDVAQLEEHRLCKPGVVGSSPIVSTGTSTYQHWLKYPLDRLE